MLYVGVGHSDDVDSRDAIRDVLSQCRASLKDTTPQAGLIFMAIDYDHELILKEINQEYPDIELIGCTTDGEVSSSQEFMEDSIVLMLFSSDDIEIKAGVGRDVSKDSSAAAREAVEEAKSKSKKKAKLCIATPESLTASCVSILEGLNSALGSGITVVGGSAGDQWRFQKSYQFYKTEVLNDSLPILLFSGNIVFSVGISSGWRPVGKRSVVTKVSGNVVYEIDNNPALEFYRYYFGGKMMPSGEYPLAVFEEDTERFYLRAPLGYDETKGSVTFAGDIPLNATVQITEADRDSILKGVEESVEMAIRTYRGKRYDAAVVFSCAARRALLGTRAAEEYKFLKKNIPEDVPICGFYTYGEIGPLLSNSVSQFHNETFVTLLLGSE